MNATKTPRKSPARPAADARTAPKRITPEKRVPRGPGGFARVTAAPAPKRVAAPRLRIGLSAAMRADLRGRAHDLDPVVAIGADGLTPGVVKEAEAAISAHQLIKVRVHGDDREERLRLYERLCAALGAEPVQHIGKLLVLYRRSFGDATPAARPEPGTGPREVVVSKPSRTGKRAPKRTRVTLLGNQRVTAGGLVKKRKPRQKSIKKSHQD